ncbi:DTW domain-containing protein [bacterium]|nr:DTW domain-containing protein [bacterium]
MALEVCMCALLPKLKVNTSVVVVMQYGEFRNMSNTGFFIPKVVPDAIIRYRGHINQIPLQVDDLVTDEFENLLLFPHDSAPVLTQDLCKTFTKPVRLFVPDGTWSQALKIVKKTPVLKEMRRVVVPMDAPSLYHLRRNQREGGMCTFEAISRALGVLEGSEVRVQMDAFFKELMRRIRVLQGLEK